jgi:hypothetical protein
MTFSEGREEHHIVREKEHIHVLVLVSLPLLTKPPVFIYGGFLMITLSNPNNLPKAPSL